MLRYSIKYLESISGIKAHTIRIWEKRYQLLEPKRTSTNIRYYDNGDLRKILNVITLLNAGHKISQVGQMSNEEMVAAVKSAQEQDNEKSHLCENLANELIISSVNFDKLSFEKAFSTSILKLGFRDTVEQVLYPALKRTGVLWQVDEVNPIHEHFFTNMVKQKLFSAIDSIAEPVNPRNKCILFLPQHEEHEIGLLYMNYLLLRAGIATTYVGQRTPLEHLLQAAEIIQPTHLVFFLTSPLPPDQANKYLKDLQKQFSSYTLVMCGATAYIESLKVPQQIVYLPTIQSAHDYFAK